MNLMILKRFKNELIILIITLITISAFLYKSSIDNLVESKRETIKSSINEINQVIELKRVWKSKKIIKKINGLQTIVSKNKIVSFKKRGQKVIIKYKGLNIKELNSIIKEIMNNPIQIVKLKINRVSKDKYSMEFICKW